MATGSLNVSTNSKIDNEIEELQNKDIELENTLKEVSTKVSGDVIKPDTLTNTTTIVNTVNKHTASMKNTMMDTGVLVTTTNQALNRIMGIYYSGNETLYAMVTATSGENNEKRNVALVKFTNGSDPIFKTIESDNLTITAYNSVGTFGYSDTTNLKIKSIVMDRDLFYSMWNDKSRLSNLERNRIFAPYSIAGDTEVTMTISEFIELCIELGYIYTDGNVFKTTIVAPSAYVRSLVISDAPSSFSIIFSTIDIIGIYDTKYPNYKIRFDLAYTGSKNLIYEYHVLGSTKYWKTINCTIS